MFDAMEFCTPELQAQLKGPRIAGAGRCFFAGLRRWLSPALQVHVQMPLPALHRLPHKGCCLASCLAPAAKEVEDRKAGLHKKQKLSEEAAAGAADGAAAAGGEAAAAPAGGEVEMKDAEGGSSAVAQAQADPGAFAGQLTGGWAAGWVWCGQRMLLRVCTAQLAC